MNTLLALLIIIIAVFFVVYCVAAFLFVRLGSIVLKALAPFLKNLGGRKRNE